MVINNTSILDYKNLYETECIKRAQLQERMEELQTELMFLKQKVLFFNLLRKNTFKTIKFLKPILIYSKIISFF